MTIHSEGWQTEARKKKLFDRMYELASYEESFQAEDIIFHQGDSIEYFCLVLSGVLKAVRYTIDGEEVISHYFYEEEILPEYLVFTDQSHFIYNLIADTRVELAFVKVSLVKNKVLNDLEWANMFNVYMASRGLISQKWHTCNSYKKLENRIAYAFLEIYGCKEDEWAEFYDTQAMIASKLNVSRPVYNQALKKFVDQGVLERDHGKIKILDYEYFSDLI